MDGKLFGKAYDSEAFDVIAYLENEWSAAAFHNGPIAKFLMDDIHTIFKKLDLPENSKQLEFGCGPSIHMTISSSRACSHIIMAEYAAQNRQMVMQWLKGEELGFSWDHLFHYIGQKEGRPAADIEKRMRSAIKEVLACDVHEDDMFGVAQLPDFDVITTCLCLDAACMDIQSYEATIAKLAGHLKPGGHIVISGVCGCSFYTVQGKKFHSLRLTRENIEGALEAAGFGGIEWYIHKLSTEGKEHDTTKFFSLVATENKSQKQTVKH